MSNPEANRKKEIQGEKFTIDGSEFVKVKPFTFRSFIKQSECDDYDSILVNFAREFGVDEDVPAKDLIKFLNDEGWDNWDENIEWLIKHKYIKEINQQAHFTYGTRFHDKKYEVILVSTESGFALVDLKTGKCPYGEIDGGSKNFVTRKNLWELLEGFEEEEFEKFIDSAH